MQGLMFTSALTLANLRGDKSRTSRCRGLDKVNEHPDEWELTKSDPIKGLFVFRSLNIQPLKPMEMQIKYPYGGVGSELYGKETYYQWGFWDPIGILKTGKYKWRFIPATSKPIYYCDTLPVDFAYRKSPVAVEGYYKRSSMMMPERASRYQIILTKIDCQRIKEITEEDCIKEGLIPHRRHIVDGILVDPRIGRFENVLARMQFKVLWDSINLKTHPWDSNPWVWALYYEVKKK